MTRWRPLGLILLLPLITGCAAAFAGIAAGPTAISRAVEARSGEDIVTDNKIVLAANRAMADIGTASASTEIYEQRLLVTGLFSEQATHDALKRRIGALERVDRLYWHAKVMSEAERAQAEALSWAETLALDTAVEAELLVTRGVADVNLRVAADPLGRIYLLGRARSDEERRRAIAAARGVNGVKAVTDYIEVRP